MIRIASNNFSHPHPEVVDCVTRYHADCCCKPCLLVAHYRKGFGSAVVVDTWVEWPDSVNVQVINTIKGFHGPAIVDSGAEIFDPKLAEPEDPPIESCE